MPQYQVMTDITNTNQVLSKDHGSLIERGTVLEYESAEKVPARIHQLEKLRVVQEVKDQEDLPIDPDADPDGDTGHGDLSPDGELSIVGGDEAAQLPEDMDDLKRMADDLGVQYAGNIGKEKLKQRILEKMAEDTQLSQSPADIAADLENE